MAEWKEFDFDKLVWEVPVERMKMRRPHLLPLSDRVVAALREIQAITGRYNRVFPRRNDITKPVSEASINQVINVLAMTVKRQATDSGTPSAQYYMSKAITQHG